MTQVTCSKCGTGNNTSDMGYCWKCKASLAPVSGSAAVPPLTQCPECGGWHGGQPGKCYQCQMIAPSFNAMIERLRKHARENQ